MIPYPNARQTVGNIPGFVKTDLVRNQRTVPSLISVEMVFAISTNVKINLVRYNRIVPSHIHAEMMAAAISGHAGMFWGKAGHRNK